MGEKIKIKDIEGDSEEVIRLFSSSDCSLSEYLNANKPIKIPLIAIGILVVVVFIINCVLWILPMEYEATRKILILASFLLGGIGTIMAHMNWKNFVITFVTAITALLVLTISMNIYTPEEAAKKVEKGVNMLNQTNEE